MGWFITFIDSSIGKKLVMSLTGLFLCSFLIVHLSINLFLLKNDGGASFNEYSSFMASGKNIPLRIIEVGLFLMLLFHFINGIRLYFLNKKARPVDYYMNSPEANSTFTSRFMIQSGSLIFIFLVVHIKTFFVSHRIFEAQETMYETCKSAFENPIYSTFYIVAMIILALHLNHGFQSGFQTLGLNNNKYTPFIKKFGTFFAVIISTGFAIIPVYFLIIKMMGGN